MSTNTDVTRLKINTLTEAQYDAAVQTGVIGENEISIITDLDESIQVDTMPTADASSEGKIYQFTGTTDQNYTNGYFYKCVSDGAVTPTYSWDRIDVQPAVDPLPSQSGNAGKFLVTDGTDASWSTTVGSTTNHFEFYNNDTPVIQERKTGAGTQNGYIGLYFKNRLTDYGSSGWDTYAALYPVSGNTWGSKHIVFGSPDYKWQGVFTEKLDNGSIINVPTVGGSLALQIATMPTAGSTYEGTIYQYTGATDSTYTNGHFYKCVSDGQTPATYSWEEISFGDVLPSQTGNAGKVLTTNGTTASWVDMTTTPQTAPVLQGTATYWITDPNTGVISQTITVQGVTPTNVVMVSPSALSAEDYAAAGIFCVDQGNGTLTFTCKTIPSVDITLTVICF